MWYAVAIIVLVIGIYWYLFVHRPRVLITEMTQAVDLVKISLYYRFCHRLVGEHGYARGSQLAGAVINLLFGEVPSDNRALEFLKEDGDGIQAETAKLIQDRAAMVIFTEAIRVHAVIESQKGLSGIVDHMNSLVNRGWISLGGDSPQPREFLEMAGRFAVDTEPLAEEVLRLGQQQAA